MADNQPTKEAEKPTQVTVENVDDLFNKMEENVKLNDAKNAKFRRRLVFLLPYNLALIWGTVQYAKNINRISKWLWPQRRKFSVFNFIFIGTLQALLFTSIYAGGNLAIIGINPFNMENSFQPDSEFVEGSSSLLIMKGLKYVGLSEETIKAIEKDIREKDLEAKEKAAAEAAEGENKVEETAEESKQDKKII